MVRSVLGVIGGVMAGFWLTLGVTKLGNRFFPSPVLLPKASPNTQEEFEAMLKAISEMVQATPRGMLLFLLLAWAVGTFVGAGISARVAASRKITYGMVVGGLFLVSNLYQILPFPYPIWFKIISPTLFLPMAYLGAKLVTIAPTQKPESFDDLADPEMG